MVILLLWKKRLDGDAKHLVRLMRLFCHGRNVLVERCSCDADVLPRKKRLDGEAKLPMQLTVQK